MAADRRRFLQLASIAPGAAVAGLAAAQPPSKAAVSTLTRSQFERCLGDEFAFEKEVFGDVKTRLAAVEPHSAPRSAAEREGRFSLRFEAVGEGGLEQASYRVHHERLGDFVLFVSPKDAQCRTVEAVFNRL